MKKFLLVGDVITSKGDRQVHYISSEKLRRLYGLSREECILTTADIYNQSQHLFGYHGLIVLRPRYHGDYREYLEKVLKGEERAEVCA